MLTFKNECYMPLNFLDHIKKSQTTHQCPLGPFSFMNSHMLCPLCFLEIVKKLSKDFFPLNIIYIYMPIEL